MKRAALTTAALCALPYFAALAVPAIVFGVLYATSGQSPLWGLLPGGIGLLGALLTTAVRGAIKRRHEETEFDELREWLRKEQERGQQ